MNVKTRFGPQGLCIWSCASFGLVTKAVALTCGLAISCSSSSARALVPKTTQDVGLEVDVHPDIVDSGELASWIEEDGQRVLAELTERERLGFLQVVITGGIYDYDVSITALREGQTVGAPDEWRCECSNEDLLQRLRSALPIAADRLIVAKSAVVPQENPAVPKENDDEKEVTMGRTPLGPIGGAGVALLTMGGTGVVGGIVLVALGKDRRRGNKLGGDVEVQDYRNPGIAVLAGGAGLALTGLVMVLLRGRNEAKRTEFSGVAPRITVNGTFDLAVSGRF